MVDPSCQWFWACEGCRLVHSTVNEPPRSCAVCESREFSRVVNTPEPDHTIQRIEELAQLNRRINQ